MKTNKPKRLSVRIPAIGWEAYISNETSKNTRAKISNFSADGAYLITKEPYELESRVRLSIKSPVISFSDTGLVVRRDPYGLGVRFLDHSESTRSSLLSIISKFLAEKKAQGQLAEEIPLCRESKQKNNFSPEPECFYSSSLLATAPCSEDSSLVEKDSSDKRECSLVICSARSESRELLKVYLSDSGKTTVKCPFCKKCHHITVPKHVYNKPILGKCNCGESFPVLFDSRKYYRKEVRLPGEYWNTFGEKDLMTVTTLSFSGAGFESGQRNPSIHSGETIRLNFLLENRDKVWIKSQALVRRVNGNQIGADFMGMDEHHQKCLGFYLMP